MNKKSYEVLLVEDSKVFVEYIKDNLKKSKLYDFNLETVENLDLAYQFIETNNIHAILLDLNLPDSSGLSTLQKIYEKYKEIPIVVITAIENESLAIKAIESGADDYMIKNNINHYFLERSLIYAIERKKSEIKLRRRLEYEQALSTCSQALLSTFNTNEDLLSALIFLKDTSRSSKITIYENYSKDKELYFKKIISTSGDSSSEKNYKYTSGFKDFRKTLSSGKFINESIRYFNKSIISMFEKDTNFVLIIPVWIEGRWYGFITFESKKNQTKWDEETIRVLLTAAEIISANIARKESRAELERTNKELKKLLDMKNDFLAIASHDLRSPFFGILGFSEVLLDNDKIINDNDLKSSVEQIKKSAQIQLDYVNDLLDIIKLESGQLKLNLEKVDLSEVILNVAENFKLLAEKKGIKIYFPNSLENCNIKAEIDSIKITQVLNNLLSNALKFTNEGGIISVWCDKNENEITVNVKDTGIGIPEKKINDIFNRYVKVHEKGTKGESGSGLGLAICKNIVQLHNGSINAVSEKEQGAHFYFTMPHG